MLAKELGLRGDFNFKRSSFRCKVLLKGLGVVLVAGGADTVHELQVLWVLKLLSGCV